jgi:hypothetical protein
MYSLADLLCRDNCLIHRHATLFSRGHGSDDEIQSNIPLKRVIDSRCCMAFITLPEWLNFYTHFVVYRIFSLFILVEMFVG